MTNAIGTQKIGKTFPGELTAAGLVLPISGFSWGNYGLDPFPPTLTAAQVSIINTVFQAHNPTLKIPPPAPAAYKIATAKTQTTVGTPGVAMALPIAPTGYWVIDIGGIEYVVPYYQKA